MSEASPLVGRDELRRMLDELARQRLSLIGRLSVYAEEWLTTRPHPGAWSLREVAEHLMLAEEATLASIRRMRACLPLRERWHHPLMRRLVSRALRSALRIPVTGRTLTPRGTAPLVEIARQWSAVHDAWRDYLEGLPAREFGAPIFRHPLRIPMTASQTLAFLQQHHEHHLAQIARIELSLVTTRLGR